MFDDNFYASMLCLECMVMPTWYIYLIYPQSSLICFVAMQLPHRLLLIHVIRFPMDLLPDTQNCGLRMCRECRERFPPIDFKGKPLVSDPGMHRVMHVRDARAVMHVGIANLRWRGKHSQHSRRMRNPQICVSGKRPIVTRVISKSVAHFTWINFYPSMDK